MATMISGIRILGKKERVLTFKTYLIYIDFHALPQTHGYGLAMLCNASWNFNDYKDTPIYKDLENREGDSFDKITREDEFEFAKNYVVKMELRDFENFPFKSAFTDSKFLWHALDEQTGIFKNQEHLPQAVYTMEVTDEKWIAHLEVGQVWESTACDYQPPYWHLEHHSEKSHKFYKVFISNGRWIANYGKVGTRGRIKKLLVQGFSSAQSKVKAKMRKSKGYQLIYKNFDTPFTFRG